MQCLYEALQEQLRCERSHAHSYAGEAVLLSGLCARICVQVSGQAAPREVSRVEGGLSLADF